MTSSTETGIEVSGKADDFEADDVEVDGGGAVLFRADVDALVARMKFAAYITR